MYRPWRGNSGCNTEVQIYQDHNGYGKVENRPLYDPGDKFDWASQGVGTKGYVFWIGKAYFLNNNTALPSGWSRNNSATLAGILLSTTSDPAFPVPQTTVAHEQKIGW